MEAIQICEKKHRTIGDTPKLVEKMEYSGFPNSLFGVKENLDSPHIFVHVE